MTSRRIVGVLVVLTALLCLGTGGYRLQLWWAKRYAQETLAPEGMEGLDCSKLAASISGTTGLWKKAPWYGFLKPYKGCWWIPRRSCYEYLKLATNQDLGDDPEAWETWFKSHPNLIWDDKLHRLVDRHAGTP